MGKWLVGSFALAAMALVAWLITAGHAPVGSAASDGADAREQPRTDHEEVVRAVQEEAPAPRELRDRVAITEAREGRDQGLEVLVVRREDGHPVADAQVWLLDSQEDMAPPPDPRQAIAWLQDPEPRARDFGTMYRTNGDGQATVQNCAAGWVVARSGDGYGERRLGPWMSRREGPVCIELERDLTLRLRAVGPREEPVAGLRLGVRYWRHQGAQLRREMREIGWTDAEGRLEYRHAQWLVASAQSDPDRGGRIVEIVACSAGFDEVVVQTFAADDWPAQELLAPVLPGGAIEVHVKGADHEAWWLALRALDAPDRDAEAGEPLDQARRARFDHVGLGKRFEVSLGSDGRNVTQVIGPTLPGQVVTCLLEVKPQVDLRSRLVDEEARPLAMQAVVLGFRTSDGAGGSRGATTDAAGIAVVRMPESFLGRSVRSIDLAGTRRTDGLPMRAEQVLDVVLQRGSNDLGDLRLPALPLIAEGIVTGLVPELLTGAQVFVEEVAGAGQDGAPSWRGIQGAIATWSDENRFEIRAHTSATQLRMTLASEGFAPAPPVEFARGARGVRIEYAAPGAIELRLLLEPGIDPRMVATVATALDEQAMPGASIATRISHRGTAVVLDQPQSMTGVEIAGEPHTRRWTGLAPGRYRIVVGAGAVSEQLTPALEVRVIAGAISRAPDVDLRGSLRRIRIELMDSDGNRLSRDANALVLVRPRQDGSAWRGEYARDGIVDLLITGPSDLAVSARGFRRTELEQVQTDQRIRLEPGPSIEVQFDLSSGPWPGEARPRVMIIRRGQPGPAVSFRTSDRSGTLNSLPETFPFGAVPLGGDGVLRWRVPEPGEYSFAIATASATQRYETEPNTIRVTDGSQQTFRVAVRTAPERPRRRNRRKRYAVYLR